MKCPTCRESMVVIEYKSVELDYCVGCMGVWFDRDEIGLVLEKAGIPVPSGTFAFSKAYNAAGEAPRPCPLCGGTMDKVSLPGSGVILDRCPEQEGIWFDAGEIARAVRDITGGGSGMILDALRGFLGEAVTASTPGKND